MNAKRYILLLLLGSMSYFSFTQGWEQIYHHSTGIAKGFDAIQTADNSYVMVGEVDLLTGAPRHYAWLLKADNSGNLLWSKVFDGGDVAYNFGRAVVEDSNGDLFIAGSNGNKATVLKTTATGDSLWTKEFGGQGVNIFHDIIQDASGNLILAGQYEELAVTFEHEVWVMGMNTEGDSLWSKRYFMPSFPGTSARDISSLSSNSFLVTGGISGQGFAMKIDGIDGTQDWVRVYQMSKEDRLFSGSINTEETRLLMGGTGSGFAGYFPVLFSTDLVGEDIQNIDFQPAPFGAVTALSSTNDAGIILTGSSYEFWEQGTDVGFITKLDADLAVEWELTYEDSLHIQGASIRQFPDGSIILAGSRQGGMWLKKIVGNPTSTAEPIVDFSTLKVYPNPAYHTLKIDIAAEINANNLSVSIYDALGRLVENNPINNHLHLIDVEQYPRGIYYYTVQRSGYRLSSGKFILQ